MYSTVIFDLDGTLIDSSAGVLKSLDAVIEHFGWEDIPQEDKLKFIGPPIIKPLKAWYHLDDELAAVAFEYFRDVYKNKYLLEAELYEDIPLLLAELKKQGKKIGVATNKREDYTLTMMEHFGLTKYCDCIYGSDFKNTVTKTDLISKCIRTLQAEKDKTVMVGDAVGDYEGAIAAEVDFIGVLYGFGFSSEKDLDNLKSRYICETVKELLGCLS